MWLEGSGFDGIGVKLCDELLETKRLLKRLLDVLREVPPKVSYGDAALYAAVVHWSSDVEWVNEGFEQDLHECLVDLEKAVAP